MLGCDRSAGVGDLRVDFLHQPVGRLVFGQQFRALQLQCHQLRLHLLEGLHVVGGTDLGGEAIRSSSQLLLQIFDALFGRGHFGAGCFQGGAEVVQLLQGHVAGQGRGHAALSVGESFKLGLGFCQILAVAVGFLLEELHLSHRTVHRQMLIDVGVRKDL